ncbi:MAG TPA: alpha/beta hydrolase [Allosphingosinicella sp.]|nr:alpha/beta hydrolase [Allosphingosinicella sp.]
MAGETAAPKLGPLAALGDCAREGPEWFEKAIARRPERTTLAVEGAELELLRWGAASGRSLLFLPGGGAHADWWSFVAPYFAEDCRVGALSFSGLGNSAWRAQYSYSQHMREALAALAALGSGQRSDQAFIVAHSYGACPALLAAVRHPEMVHGAILLDPPLHYSAAPPAPVEKKPPRAYATERMALDRFRLAGDSPNLYVIDYIARKSVRRTEDGWMWKGDHEFWRHMSHEPILPALASASSKMALVFGASSALTAGGAGAKDWGIPDHVPQMILPEAGHNVMVDQPLALVAAVRAIMSIWS